MAYMHYSLCMCSVICECRCGFPMDSTIYNILCSLGLLAPCILDSLLAIVSLDTLKRGDDNEFERNLRLEKVVSRKVLKLAGERRRQKSMTGE